MQPGNPDIREEVERNRGLLKKIQLHVPLFKGYRQLEDLRVADELLRKQISNVLVNTLKNLQDARVALVNEGKFQTLNSIATQISEIQEFQGEILHAQQGYSGISASIQMDESKVSALYDSDLKLLESTAKLQDLSQLSGSANIGASLNSFSDALKESRQWWDDRIARVKGILLSTGGSQ